jgi:hypothetical protein
MRKQRFRSRQVFPLTKTKTHTIIIITNARELIILTASSQQQPRTNQFHEAPPRNNSTWKCSQEQRRIQHDRVHGFMDIDQLSLCVAEQVHNGISRI